ncbi:MAG: hypothetical protein L6V93_05935 [Clostridiales bacterium]|nr:MAG: hypothetical protein L6V93_05935 [Clostridiales bacterium]
MLLTTVNGGANFSQTDVKYSGIRSFTTFKRGENERFFGFGARMYKLDRTGSSVDIFLRKGRYKKRRLRRFSCSVFYQHQRVRFVF